MLQNILDEYKLPILADIHIIQLLASFSRGFALQCGSCNDIVMTDTKYQFYLEQDREGNTIYYYQPKYLNYARKSTVLVNKKQYRLFCAVCTKSKLKVCSYKAHYGATCKKEDVQNICGMHPYCVRCKEQDELPLIQCQKCRETLCDKHVLDGECDECTVRHELRTICRAIRLSVKKNTAQYGNIHTRCGFEDVCDLIAQFGIGCLINCDNTYCKRILSFNNKYEYGKLSLDSNGKVISRHVIPPDFLQDGVYGYMETVRCGTSYQCPCNDISSSKNWFIKHGGFM
eukprot:1063449_1